MFNCNKKEIEQLKKEIEKIRDSQEAFILHISGIMKSVLDNDKRKFMYELQQEDIELIEDGHKLRKIRKIIQ